MPRFFSLNSCSRSILSSSCANLLLSHFLSLFQTEFPSRLFIVLSVYWLTQPHHNFVRKVDTCVVGLSYPFFNLVIRVVIVERFSFLLFSLDSFFLCLHSYYCHYHFCNSFLQHIILIHACFLIKLAEDNCHSTEQKQTKKLKFLFLSRDLKNTCSLLILTFLPVMNRRLPVKSCIESA